MRTRATLRRAEFGFFGVVVYTRVQTPRRCGAATFFLRPLPDLRPGVASFFFGFLRPLLISWLVVGMRKRRVAGALRRLVVTPAVKEPPHPLHLVLCARQRPEHGHKLLKGVREPVHRRAQGVDRGGKRLDHGHVALDRGCGVLDRAHGVENVLLHVARFPHGLHHVALALTEHPPDRLSEEIEHRGEGYFADGVPGDGRPRGRNAGLPARLGRDRGRPRLGSAAAPTPGLTGARGAGRLTSSSTPSVCPPWRLAGVQTEARRPR